MADRRTDDSPIAPRRSLGAPGASREGSHVASPADPGASGQRRAAGGGERGTASQPASATRKERPSASGSQTGRTSTTTSASRAGGSPRSRTRKARLRLTHLDPWSVMKTAFLLSVAFGIVTVIAVSVVWSVLGAAGVWSSINQTVAEVIGGDTGAAFDVENYVGTSRVMGFTMIVAVVDVVLITAIATLGAFLYNLAATLLGGIEVTLAEDDR